MENQVDKHSVLKELEDNLIHDELNFEDRSVGIYSVSNLEDWAKDGLVDYEGLTLVSVTKENCIISCEGFLYEIYLEVYKDGNEIIDSEWKVRLYEEN